VRGGRAKNAEYRQREYLTEGEIDKLIAAEPQPDPRPAADPNGIPARLAG
jgi:hypothetical protein